MKKKLIGIILLLFSIFYINADENLMFSGKCYEYNSFLKGFVDKEYAIKYDDESDIFYLRTSDLLNNAWIHLSWNDVSKLRKNMEKYFEWEKIATEQKAEIEKQLPDSTITTKVTWKYGDNWYSANSFNLSFVFFSQDITRHQFVLSTSKATGSNQFVSYKIDGYYFDKEQVQELFDAINEENIKKQISDFKKNKEKEALFN